MVRLTPGFCAVLLLLSVPGFLVSSASAQLDPKEEVKYSPQLIDDLTSLRDAALSSNYAYVQAAHLTENIGARPSGSPQATITLGRNRRASHLPAG